MNAAAKNIIGKICNKGSTIIRIPMSYFCVNADVSRSTAREIRIDTITNYRSVIERLLEYYYKEQKSPLKREAEVHLNEEDFQISHKRRKMI